MIAALNLVLFVLAAILVLTAFGAVDIAFSQSRKEIGQRFLTAAAGQLGMVLVLCLLMERIG